MPLDVFLMFAPLLVGIVSFVASTILFSRGWPWIAAYSVAISIIAFGGTLIFRAKLPAYRQKRFFTFGTRVLPRDVVPLYRRGWRFVFIGSGIALVLLIAGR